MANNYQKEQVQKIQATPQEMDAWEALRREPGLMGRLARRGKHMKRDYVGGRRSFQPPGGGDSKKTRGKEPGGGPRDDRPDRGNFETRPEVIQGRSTAAGRGGDYTGQQNQQQSQGQGGPAPAPAPSGPTEAEIREKLKNEKEEKYKKETEERKKRRAELSAEYGGYKDEYGELKDEADYTETRDALSGYQTGADQMARDAGTKFGGYESQIGLMPDRGAQVGQLGAEALDTQKLMKDRGLFAGQIEAQRKAGEKGKMANLRRSMAAAGSSPEEIARAEAEASSGAQAGREDALAASMGAMQARQGQLGQAASLYGQGQSLGLQRTGAQAGMYGQGLQAQTGLMQMGAGLANQQQMSMQNQIAQQQGLIGSQAGMTDAQMQDIVAQQNAAQQADLAERGLTATANAAAAGAPQGPSQTQQLMGLVQTGASVKIAMACIPEGTTIDMADGGKVPIEEIKVGDFVIGLDNKKDEVLQVHQYKEDPEPARFATVTFDDGSIVNCCDKHRISNKRAEDYKLQDKVGNREVTSIDWHNGVNRSYDLLTATGGYRINGVPVNTMIPEMAEAIVNLNNKLAA